LFAERDAWFRQLLERHITDGLTDKSIRREVDPGLTAVAIIGLLRGTALMAFSTARDVKVDKLASEVAGGVRRSLAARDRADFQTE
jgi:hypothetical protein